MRRNAVVLAWIATAGILAVLVISGAVVLGLRLLRRDSANGPTSSGFLS